MAKGPDTVTWPPSAGRRGHAAGTSATTVLCCRRTTTLHDSQGSWACLCCCCCLPPLLSNDGALQLGQVRSGFARLAAAAAFVVVVHRRAAGRHRGTAEGREKNPKSRDVLARTNKQTRNRRTRILLVPLTAASTPAGAGRVDEPGTKAAASVLFILGNRTSNPMQEPLSFLWLFSPRWIGERSAADWTTPVLGVSTSVERARKNKLDNGSRL